VVKRAVTNGPAFWCFELARVLVRFDHVARFIVNAMILTRLRSRKRKKKERELLARARYEWFSIYELSSHEVARHDF